MQKDRNAQFMIAEVEEVNIPATQKPEDIAPQAEKIDESKYLVKEEQEITSSIK